MWKKITWIRLIRWKFIGVGGPRRSLTVSLLWAPSTATANVTNASFKSSTLHSTPANNFIGLWTIGKSMSGNGGGFSQLFAEIHTGHPVCIFGPLSIVFRLTLIQIGGSFPYLIFITKRIFVQKISCFKEMFESNAWEIILIIIIMNFSWKSYI